jgi:hypothetical protein
MVFYLKETFPQNLRYVHMGTEVSNIFLTERLASRVGIPMPITYCITKTS